VNHVTCNQLISNKYKGNVSSYVKLGQENRDSHDGHNDKVAIDDR